MNKLKPCPFCGKQPTIEAGESDDDEWFILCERGGHSVCIQHISERAAIDAWNTRAKTPMP